MDDRTMADDVTAFEAKLGLKRNFYRDLLTNDDWSFVIKLNALFEAACTHALAQRLSCPELVDDLTYLEFADQKKGKIKFLKSLGAITQSQAKILYKLASLRNDLVHNVAQVSFLITDHFAGLDKNQLKAECELWGHGLCDPVTFLGKHVSRQEFVRTNPKLAIWLTCMEVLACLYLEFELAEFRAARQVIPSVTKL